MRLSPCFQTDPVPIIAAVLIGAFVFLAGLTGSAWRAAAIVGSFVGFCTCVALYLRSSSQTSD